MKNSKQSNVKQNKDMSFLSVKGIDISIIFIAIFLSIFCLVFVFSASAFEASEVKTYFNFIKLNDSLKLLMKTLAFIMAGILSMFVIATVNFKSLKTKAPFIYSIISNPLLYYIVSVSFFVFIEIMKHVGTDAGGEGDTVATVGAGFIKKANGAYRWINIPHTPISFQPSEVAKLLLIICFAIVIFNAGMILKHKRGMILYMFLAFIPAFSVFKFSSDLSSSIVVFGILYIMMFVAAPDFKNTLILTGFLALIVALAFGGLVLFNHGKEEADIKPYQAKRILAWLYPEDYPASADQTNQALYAIGSGGLVGEGLGNSIQKIKKLPEAQNDMIFALICEELGLFGGILVILLYAVLIFRMYMIVLNTDNLFDRMIVVGVIAHIGLQVIINICVVTRLFPNTGIPLPLISAGGSSIVGMYMELGLVLNVGKSIERK